MGSSDCLDDDAAARLAAGEVPPDERLEILAHADGCEDCRAVLVALAQGSADRTEQVDDETVLASMSSGRMRSAPRPGDVIDHYTVVDSLGQGAMGQVVRARDSELGRDVALKLLIRTGSENAERRLVREAQAMAQLSHPNVVTVHAVGRYPGGVYLAMELVRGQTLRTWCEDQTRGWAEIVGVFVSAGEGLMAAHAAGIIHRDFKPDNVLVGDDGQVRVSDFGLAGVGQTFTSEDGDSLELGTNLTRTGVLMGTPRFMAPEQYEDVELDARADQFAFGVALYHALYGAYPFEGDNVAELQMSVSAGVPVAPPLRTDVPRAVWQAVQRCIERDPQRRYPSMRAVNHDLRRVLDAPARRRRLVGVGVVGTAMLAGGVALGVGLGGGEGPQPCAALGERLAGVWDEARSQEVADALARAKDAEAGGETATRVRARLDDYAARWVQDAQQACEATHVHGVQPEAQLQAHTRCLDERRAALDALVGQLVSRAADDVLERAVPAAAALPSIAACAERGTQLAEIPAPLEASLARLSSELSLGAYEDVEREAASLDAEVTQPRARGRLLLLRGRANAHTGRRELAVDQLRAAALAAAEAQDDRVVARVQIELLREQTAGLERYGASDILFDAARVAVRRAGDPAGLRERLAVARTGTLLAREAYSDAMEQIEQALAALDERGGGELSRASVLSQRAMALAALHREGEALDDAQRVLQVRLEQLGEHHPSVGEAHENLARVLMLSGRVEEAQQHLQVALAAIERRGGPQALPAAEVLMMLAGSEMENDPARALTLAERSLGILVHHGRGGSQNAFSVRNMIGVGYSLQGDHERARTIFAETIEAREKAGGADDPAFAFDLHLYAEVLTHLEDFEDALPVYERLAEVASDESPFVAVGLAGAGMCRMELGQAGGGELLERAVAHPGIRLLEDVERAAINFGLAQARWAEGKQGVARELVEVALGQAAGAEGEPLRADIEAWRAEHGA